MAVVEVVAVEVAAARPKENAGTHRNREAASKLTAPSSTLRVLIIRSRVTLRSRHRIWASHSPDSSHTNSHRLPRCPATSPANLTIRVRRPATVEECASMARIATNSDRVDRVPAPSTTQRSSVLEASNNPSSNPVWLILQPPVPPTLEQPSSNPKAQEAAISSEAASAAWSSASSSTFSAHSRRNSS